MANIVSKVFYIREIIYTHYLWWSPRFIKTKNKQIQKHCIGSSMFTRLCAWFLASIKIDWTTQNFGKNNRKTFKNTGDVVWVSFYTESVRLDRSAIMALCLASDTQFKFLNGPFDFIHYNDWLMKGPWIKRLFY